VNILGEAEGDVEVSKVTDTADDADFKLLEVQKNKLTGRTD
jgi:hypothetical protein